MPFGACTGFQMHESFGNEKAINYYWSVQLIVGIVYTELFAVAMIGKDLVRSPVETLGKIII